MTDTFTEAPIERPPRRSGRLAPMIAILLLAALALTVSGVFPFRQLIQQRRQVEAAQTQLESLVEQNALLETDLAALETDEEVERIAREQYGLVRPGETAFVVVQPDARSEFDVSTHSEPVVEEPSRPWWERMWLFVTGGDVDGNG